MYAGVTRNHQILLSRLLWFGVCACAYYFVARLLLQEKFGFHDWYLFIGHAQDFVNGSVLYDRDLTHYAPSAPIYKFPPLFVSLLVLLLDIGLNQKTIHLLAWAGHLACYFLSVGLCISLFRPTKSIMFVPLAWILALTFEPFFDNYDSAQMEMYLLLLLTLCLWYHDKARQLAAGVCIGIAAAIKIYPIYFAGYYLASRNTLALAGVALGLLITLLFSLSLTHSAGHLFYFTKILPTLLTESISPRGENLSLARLLITYGLSGSFSIAICNGILLLPFVIIFFTTSRSGQKKSGQDLFWLCLLSATMLFAMKNSWWNYQILLLPALLLALSHTLTLPKTRWLPFSLLLAAWFMIFWCNLGKLETLILFATRILDASTALTAIMLQTGFLRGLATFLILLSLIVLRCRHTRLS